MLCAIFYLESLDKSRFSNLKKRVEKDYVLNKVDYSRTVTAVQSLILNHQPNYNSNRKSQSNGITDQLMSVQRWKNGDDDSDTKDGKQKPKINLDHITCNGDGKGGTIWVTMSDLHIQN